MRRVGRFTRAPTGKKMVGHDERIVELMTQHGAPIQI
jgi:hypothetical protein